MPSVTFTTFTGERHTVEVPAGTSLMRAATDHRVPGIDGDCGGVCACATCHVYVQEPWLQQLPHKSATEVEMLGFTNAPQANSRLACQVLLLDSLDGMQVALPEGQH